MVEVRATDILAEVSKYSANKGVAEEAGEIPIDIALLGIDSIRREIERQGEMGGKEGFEVIASEGEGKDIEIEGEGGSIENGPEDEKDGKEKEEKTGTDIKSFERKWRTYYSRILFFAFLSKDGLTSTEDILKVSRKVDNRRILGNLGIDVDVLRLVLRHMDKMGLNALDYKIQNLSRLANDVSVAPMERAETALRKFGRLGASEIVTPPEVCKEMLGYLGDDVLREAVSRKRGIIDINSKIGEFAIATSKRMEELGYKRELYCDLIYSIPSSAHAYEFTRKIYEVLGLEVGNIAEHFTSYDLLKVKNKRGEVDNDKIRRLLNQRKPMNKITIEDEVEKMADTMRFEAAIGNPPYQEEASGSATGSDPIYHLLFDIARMSVDKGVTIQPGRFLFNAGKTPKEWNQKMLNDIHLKVCRYEGESAKVFPLVDLKGGVSILRWDDMEEYGKTGVFVANDVLRGMLSKVLQQVDFRAFSEIVYPRDLYRLTEKLYEDNPWAEGRHSKGHRYDVGSNIFKVLPELFFEEESEEENAGILGRTQSNGRSIKWIKREYIETPDNFGYFKVFIPKSNGTCAFGEVLSSPLIGKPCEGCSTTFLCIGKFETLEEAEACLKYIKTKFMRAMLGTLKVTQDNPKSTWANVPMQDFTSKGDIDWTVDIEGIDRQLYDKYGLTDEERAFVEREVREMK